MCGRYTLRRIELIRAALDAATPSLPGFEEFTERPRFNVAPSQTLPIARLAENGKRELVFAKWGFIPSWAKEKPKLAPINARGETVSTSGMFRSSFARRRCLVPADGFYEWQGMKGPPGNVTRSR